MENIPNKEFFKSSLPKNCKIVSIKNYIFIKAVFNIDEKKTIGWVFVA